MESFCVDITGISDVILAFLGYQLIDENEEYKTYRDKYAENHLVEKALPRLYVDDLNDALSLKGNIIVRIDHHDE